MSEPATIRLATEADVGALLRLLEKCVTAMRAAGIEQWDEVYPNLEIITQDIAASTLHVLTADAQVIAAITVDDTMDPLWRDLDWSVGGEPALAVHRLMVEPTWQGRGCGRRMMEHAETVALQRGCRSIRLDTFLQNPVAMALYPRLGYRPTGVAMMRKGAFSGFEKMLVAGGAPARAAEA